MLVLIATDPLNGNKKYYDTVTHKLVTVTPTGSKTSVDPIASGEGYLHTSLLDKAVSFAGKVASYVAGGGATAPYETLGEIPTYSAPAIGGQDPAKFIPQVIIETPAPSAGLAAMDKIGSSTVWIIAGVGAAGLIGFLLLRKK